MRATVVLLTLWFLLCGAAASAPRSVYIEELTWTELRDAVRAGNTTVIIPVGGTEQSGPHIALGKHNVRVKALAGKVARSLGDALVAPVVAYVPEGNVAPPTGHMRFPGTISVPDLAFEGVLEGAARSLKQHGFLDVVFIGDHGGYQSQLKAVAMRLQRAWAGSATRAHYIEAYYRVAASDFPRILRDRGLTDEQIGTHAGAADTSLIMAIDDALVRRDRMPANAHDGLAVGVTGDPRPSSVVLGQVGVDLIVTKTVAAIRSAVGGKR